MCVSGVEFASFYDFPIGYWNRSHNVVFFYILFYSNLFESQIIGIVL